MMKSHDEAQTTSIFDEIRENVELSWQMEY